jgi:F-type H+-transporting ATPase subunit b
VANEEPAMRAGLPVFFSALLLLAFAGSVRAEDREVKLTPEEIKELLKRLPEGDKGAADLREKLKEAEKPHERNIFERALDLGIWTLVVFLILLFILNKYAWQPILRGLEQRERDIASAGETARKAKEEAAELQQRLAEERQKGADQVRQMMEDARRAADQVKEQRIAEAEAKIQEDRERLQRENNIERDQIRKEGFTQLADLAALISAKAIRRELSPEVHRGLVDEALNELNLGGKA